MNVAVYQEKNENAGQRETEKEKKQWTYFIYTEYCLSAVVQRATRRKSGLYEESARGNWDPWEGQRPFPPNPNGVGYRTITLMRLLIGPV